MGKAQHLIIWCFPWEHAAVSLPEVYVAAYGTIVMKKTKKNHMMVMIKRDVVEITLAPGRQ